MCTSWWNWACPFNLWFRIWSVANKGCSRWRHHAWRWRVGSQWWRWGPPWGGGLRGWGRSLRQRGHLGRPWPLCSLFLRRVLAGFWFFWDSFWSLCWLSCGILDNLSCLLGNPAVMKVIHKFLIVSPFKLKPYGLCLRSNTHIVVDILDLKYFAQFRESWQGGTLLVMKAPLTVIWLQPFSWSASVFMHWKRNVVWPHAQSDTIELWWASKMEQNLCSKCLSIAIGQDGPLSQSIKSQRKLGQYWPHAWAKMHIYCWPFLQVRLSSHSQLPVIQSITVVSVQGNDQILQISFSQWDLPWPDDVPKLLPRHRPVFVFISLSKQVQETQSLVLQVLLYNSQCSGGGVVDGWHTSILSSYRGVLFNHWGRSRRLYESNQKTLVRSGTLSLIFSTIFFIWVLSWL